MKRKYFVYFLVALLASLGWNMFLIKRDQEMFKAYYHQKALQELKK
jgi:hypothetical protein